MTSSDEMKQQLKEAAIENEMLKSEIIQLKRQLEASEKGLFELYNSTSWKITLPIRKIRDFFKKIKRGFSLLQRAPEFFSHVKRHGLRQSLKRVRSTVGSRPQVDLSKFIETPDSVLRQQRSARFESRPLISVVVPLYNTNETHCKEMLESVLNQTYAYWQLVLVDASDSPENTAGTLCAELASHDDRVIYMALEENKGISLNTNVGLEAATGDFITLLDHDDILHQTALYEVVKAINEEDADLVFSDEANYYGGPLENSVFHFKSDYAPDTLRSYNYICHLMVFSAKLYQTCGGMRPECEGSQDYDLALRLCDSAQSIVHIAKPLYFWRHHTTNFSKDEKQLATCIASAHKALDDHLKRVGLKGKVVDAAEKTNYKIEYEIEGSPLISIIIPNKDHVEDLKKCLDSILAKTTYDNYEILVVENNSEERGTFSYYEDITSSRVHIHRYSGTFNFSAINNFAASKAQGEYLLFLNNDTEVITPNWLEEMLMFAQREDVGAVGAKLYYPDESIQHAGVILGIGGVAGHSHKGYARDSVGYANRLIVAQNLSAVTGACLMVKASKFWETEGFDERLAVAFNDIDLCMKLRGLGYLNIFTPFAELYHYESKSRGYEDTLEKSFRFKEEIIQFHLMWDDVLEKGDPYYNVNLTLEHEDFSIA